MMTVPAMRKDIKRDTLLKANSRTLFQAPFVYTPRSSSSSSSSIKSESIRHKKIRSSSSRSSLRESSPARSTITRPNSPTKILRYPLIYNNEVLVCDVNGARVLYSLLERKGAWFLDVSDLDAMDEDSVFQYLAIRPSPQTHLILTRVPELRHLVYVHFDEEGRPYPIQMRRVTKAKYLPPIEEHKIVENQEPYETFWKSLSGTLRRTVSMDILRANA